MKIQQSLQPPFLHLTIQLRSMKGQVWRMMVESDFSLSLWVKAEWFGAGAKLHAGY